MRWVVVVALVVSCGIGLADELPEDTNEIKALTVEQAEALAKLVGEFLVDSLSLDGLTTITPDVAEALAKHESYLSLYGLTTITPEVAEALAKFKGELSLGGLTTISPETLKILRANPAIDVPSEFDE